MSTEYPDRKILIKYWCGFYDDIEEKKIEIPETTIYDQQIKSLKESPLLDKIADVLHQRNRRLSSASTASGGFSDD